jgi:hypothetical protein
MKKRSVSFLGGGRWKRSVARICLPAAGPFAALSATTRARVVAVCVIGVIGGFLRPAFAGGGVYLNPLAVGTSLQALPDVQCSASATLVVPADSGQLSAILANVGAGAARCGDSGVNASRGVQIAATSGTATFDTVAAIYCYCAAGSTIAVTRVER